MLRDLPGVGLSRWYLGVVKWPPKAHAPLMCVVVLQNISDHARYWGGAARFVIAKWG